jgi:hypothetical protein
MDSSVAESSSHHAREEEDVADAPVELTADAPTDESTADAPADESTADAPVDEPTADAPTDERPSCVRTFNRTLRQFVDDLKLTFPELSDSLDEQYGAIEEDTEEYVKWFDVHTSNHIEAITNKDEGLFEEHDPLFLLPTLNFAKLWRCNIDDRSREAIWRYLHLLLVLTTQYKEDAGTIEEMFREWNAMLEDNIVDDEDLQSMKEHADGMMRLLKSLSCEAADENDDGGEEAEASSKAKAKAKAKRGPFDMGDLQADPFFKELTESKIAQFAKELSSDICPEDLGISDLGNIRSVQDAFKCLGEKPDKIMGLVQTVGEKIQGKLTSGDIRQADLMADAHQLMEKMHDSPIFKEMFKAQKRGGRRRRKGGGSRRAANDVDPQNLMHDFASKLGIDPAEIMRMSESLMAETARKPSPSREGESTRDRLRSELRRRKEVAAALASVGATAAGAAAAGGAEAAADGRATTAKKEKAAAATTKSKRKRKKGKKGAGGGAAAATATTHDDTIDAAAAITAAAATPGDDRASASAAAANARDEAILECAAEEVGI